MGRDRPPVDGLLCPWAGFWYPWAGFPESVEPGWRSVSRPSDASAPELSTMLVSGQDPHRPPTLPAPVGTARASPGPPPEGVNPGGELAGKSPRRGRPARAERRLDVCGGAVAGCAAAPSRSTVIPPKTGV
ncbi:hypothetical protein GCM10023220_14410 [Streptomyces ziwulingensis]|uniref:Uncharacterized protein n=1 Tax=Streptomyces ziwulingensis TaxID=1045501 RepID=A0ABP9B6S5_9ACTN